MNNLADAYLAAGRAAEAEPLLTDLLAIQRRKLGRDDPALAGTLAMLGKVELNLKKYAEAEPPLRECLAIRDKKLPDDWSRFNAMSLSGAVLAGQKKYAEAEPLLIQGYEGLKARAAKIPAPGKSNLAEAAERIVRLYEAWGKPEKAAEWRKRLGMPDAGLPGNVFER